MPPAAQNEYWGAVQMAYFPFYAFEEIPAVFGDKADDVLSLTTAIKRIARAITDPPIDGVPLLATDVEAAEDVRKEIVRWYLRPSTRPPDDAVRLAQELFDALDDGARSAMLRVLLRLVLVAQGQEPTAKAASVDDFDDSDSSRC